MSRKEAKQPSKFLGLFGETRNQGYGPGEVDYITWPAARKMRMPGPLFDLPAGMKPKEADSLFFPPKPALSAPDAGAPESDPYAIVMQLAQLLKGIG